MLTYDITNQQSFKDLEDWLDLVSKFFVNSGDENDQMPMLILLGNKIDLNNMQAVKQDTHRKFAIKNGLTPYYVSAKTGD